MKSNKAIFDKIEARERARGKPSGVSQYGGKEGLQAFVSTFIFCGVVLLICFI